MIYAALVLALGSIVGLVLVAGRFRERLDSLETASHAPGGALGDEAAILRRLDGHDQALDKLAGHLDAHVDKINELEESIRAQNLAISEGIEHADRAERRVRSTVRRAVERMEAAGYIDEAVEAEAAGIREIDAAELRGEGVQPMRESMETAPPDSGGLDFSDLPGDWS